MAELCPLFSGSTGNSYYIGSKSSGILVDIGRSCKQVTTVMQRCGIDPLSVQGILITHEHSDHISGLRVFASKYHIPVFASKGTLGALESMGILNDKYPAYTIEDTLELAGMHVNAFRTPHDCTESFGYRIEAEDGHTVTVATDIGHITPEVEENLHGTDLAVIESNHDIGMLRTGPYPYSLKRRILSDFGHLSNTACADLLPDYFSFVKGLVDSEDLSLNISRELLQHDRQLKIIAKALEKSIRNELTKLLKNDRAAYEKFFEAFGLQLKFGVYNGYGMNKDALKDLLLFYSSSEKKPVTLAEYVSRMKEDQTCIYYATGENIARIDHLPQTELVKDKGFEILYLTENVDEFAIKMLMNYEGKEFKSVSAGDLDLETEEEKKEIEEKSKEHADLFNDMQKALEGKVKSVRLSQRLKSHPVCLTSEGALSLEMEKVLNAMPTDQKVQADRVLEINPEHPIFAKLVQLQKENPDKLKAYAKLLYDQALLIEGMSIEDPVAFSNQICELMA